MRARATWMAAGIVLLAGSLFAQEPARDDDDRVEGPVRQIRVLENPYDISSFYRSRDEGSASSPYPGGDRYPIANYYRSRQSSFGYSRFWTGGYGARRLGYRRSIGQNGDLFLFAPTFLAPLGPLASDRW